MRVSSFPSFVRGDTVTMEFKTGLDLAHVSSAVLVIEQCGYTITKEGDALEVAGGSVRGTLTPSESMTLIPGEVSVQLSLRFEDGTVFTSDPETWMVENRVGGSTGSSTVLADAEFSAYVGIPVPAPHPDLEGRDLPDQHPIAAVTGLEDALASKADGVATAQALASKADADATERALADRVGRDEFSRAMDGKADTAAFTGEAMQRVEGDTALRMLISDEVRDRRDAVSSEASARDAAVASLSTRIDRKQDLLTAGKNVTIIDGVISAAGTEYGQATTTAPGLMSASDKAKLDTVARGAEPNVIESVRVNGSPLSVTSDGAVNVDLTGYATKADLSTIPKWDKVVVDELPTTGIQLDKIYLVPNSGSGTNSRDEYIYVDGKWELIGTTETDISGKQDVITGAASTVTSADLTAGRVLVSDSAGKIVADATTVAELHFLGGTTSNIQTQIDSEATARADADADIRRAVAEEASARDAAVKAEADARADAMGTLQGNIGGKVSKAGDTMTGALTLSGKWNDIVLTHPDIKVDTIPTQWIYKKIRAMDGDGNRIGELVFNKNVDGSQETLIRAWIEGSDAYSNANGYISLGLRKNLDGTVNTTSPSPTNSADNSQQIATTAWVNTASSVVHTTGVEVISGEKNFQGGLVTNHVEVFGATPFIDFHFDNNTIDYTTRLINNADGSLRISTRTLDNTKVLHLIIDANTQTASLSAPTRSTGYGTTDIVTAGWADEKFVKRAGDSMNGILTVNDDIIRVHSSPEDTLPSAYENRGSIYFRDLTGTNRGVIRCDADTTYTRTYFTAERTVNGGRVVNRMDLRILEDGTSIMLGVTPSNASENSTQIATTAWVNSAPTVVHTAGNEKIAGTKTFTSGPRIECTWPIIIMKDTDEEIGVAPSGWRCLGGVGVQDKNGVEVGRVETTFHTNGTMVTGMVAQNQDADGNTVTGTIKVNVGLNGTVYATAPATRSSGYASTEIATAGWVDDKIASQKAETWTFTLDDGSTVTKEVLVR